MTSYGYIIMIIVESCMIWFHFDCIMQLKKLYHIATNVCSRKSATTFGDLPDWIWSFDVIFDVSLNEQLKKYLSCGNWRHSNTYVTSLWLQVYNRGMYRASIDIFNFTISNHRRGNTYSMGSIMCDPTFWKDTCSTRDGSPTFAIKLIKCVNHCYQLGNVIDFGLWTISTFYIWWYINCTI